MRLKFLTALAAIPFATAAQSANIYLACFYQDDMGKLPITQLFTLKGDAIGDSYPTWGYDGIAEWEAQFATQPDQVRETSSYTEKNIIGQFSKFAEANGDSHSVCWVTTKKDHAFAWFAKESAKGRLDVGRIKDWRPIKAGVLGVQDWSGNPVKSAYATPEPDRDGGPAPSPSPSDTAAADIAEAPVRPKKSNAQADAEYAVAMAEYNAKLEARQKQVEDYERAQAEVARKKAEQRLAAERALAEHQTQVAAADAAQLEYKKQLARPAGVANAVYRGFSGADCDTARRSALLGTGTSSGTKFVEVEAEPVGSQCMVRGWWWDTSTTGSSRQ